MASRAPQVCRDGCTVGSISPIDALPAELRLFLRAAAIALLCSYVMPTVLPVVRQVATITVEEYVNQFFLKFAKGGYGGTADQNARDAALNFMGAACCVFAACCEGGQPCLADGCLGGC